MRSSATYTRDAALRKLARINRWLIAASVALTAVLSEAAAQAFPGKSTTAAKRKAKLSSAPSKHHASQPSGGAATSPGSLKPPAQAPSAAGEAQPESSSGSREASPPKAAPESAPAQEAAPAPEPPPESTHESAPAPQESAPAPEPAPAQEAPVVSGGS